MNKSSDWILSAQTVKDVLLELKCLIETTRDGRHWDAYVGELKQRAHSAILCIQSCLTLRCPACGIEEGPPYDVNDSCICGTLFAPFCQICRGIISDAEDVGEMPWICADCMGQEDGSEGQNS
jgi:hypothetical protein